MGRADVGLTENELHGAHKDVWIMAANYAG